LEVLNQTDLGSNGLKPVTLDLNGGSFVSARDEYGEVNTTVTDNIQIICAGNSFTATSDVGLTRPEGNVGSFFEWNTAADGSGDSYAIGDSVPSSVTTLYAQWAESEQFDLSLGGTYYFDLSGEVENIGTINAGYAGYVAYPSVPDTSLHYVPFTYTGTVNAYSLDSDSIGVPTNEEMASRQSLRTLFLSEYNVSHTISWNDLHTNNLIFGKTFDTHYTLRSLSGGSDTVGEWPAEDVTPSNNEWDQILEKSALDEPIKNFSYLYSWAQDTVKPGEYQPEEAKSRSQRGGMNADSWFAGRSSAADAFSGWRPALEVLNPATLGTDGLQAVELYLNGGSFVSERDEDGEVKTTVTDHIQIICAGDSFTATSDVGLTPPTDKVFVSWNTKADGSGAAYPVGAEVSSSVTELY
ncbi:MAG: hypothetical protein ACK5NL_22265, partial [Vibrio fluvialis]